MVVFGSAKTCSLPGNICPVGGSHFGSTICANPYELETTPQKKDTANVISETEITEIVTQVVTKILNEIYAKESGSIDEELNSMQMQSIPKEEW